MGDRGILRDEVLTITGRTDDQTKVLGVRVHLSEVCRAITESFPQFTAVHCVSVSPPEQLHFATPVIVVLYIHRRLIHRLNAN